MLSYLLEIVSDIAVFVLKRDVKLQLTHSLTENQHTLKPQFPLVVLDYLRSCSDCKIVEFISQKLVSSVQLGSDSDIAQVS